MATSLGDILKVTGLSKGSIYGNFKNKEEVALAVWEYTASTVMDALRLRIQAAAHAPDKLRAIVDFYEQYVSSAMIKGGCPILNAAVQVDDLHPELRVKVLRTIDHLHQAMRKIIQRGITAQQLRADTNVEELSTFFIAALEGAIMLSRVQGDANSYHMICNQLHKMISEIEVK